MTKKYKKEGKERGGGQEKRELEGGRVGRGKLMSPGGRL